MNRPLAALIGAVLVAAAVTITVLEPTDIQREAPFVTRAASLDSVVTTRTLKVAVTDVRLADRLTTDEWVGTTNGVWLVIDVQFESRVTSTSLVGSLTIGGTEYLPSARAEDVGLESAYSDPGLPWAKSIIFELPRSALEGADASRATVQLGPSADPRLEGVAEWQLDLGALQHPTSIAVTKPGRVAG